MTLACASTKAAHALHAGWEGPPGPSCCPKHHARPGACDGSSPRPGTRGRVGAGRYGAAVALEAEFDAPLWRWNDGSWQFVTVPAGISDQIDDLVPDKAGFGSVNVTARIGPVTWSTSVFPSKEEEAFVLPVKKDVRIRNDVDEGDTVHVHLRVGIANR